MHKHVKRKNRWGDIVVMTIYVPSRKKSKVFIQKKVRIMKKRIKKKKSRK
ncbi:hypothetical protein K8942_00845 [Candidatus Peribacteria bacterium]|nr:MAG: hypothetical protein K8942_00845 [Candidatus Peribacteria bacterium]